MDATPSTRKLGELIPGWPNDGPEDLAELGFLPDEAIAAYDPVGAELVRQLRTQVRRAAISWGRSAQLSSPEAVEKALSSNDLRVLGGQWLTLALDRNRRRTFRPFGSDSSRTVEKLSKWVPPPEKLPTLPDDGCYLVLYGGSPGVLAIDDVRERLRTLQREVPVADVLFRQREDGRVTLFSLREGFGVCNHDRVEFPQPELVDDAALWARRGDVPAPEKEGGGSA